MWGRRPRLGTLGLIKAESWPPGIQGPAGTSRTLHLRGAGGFSLRVPGASRGLKGPPALAGPPKGAFKGPPGASAPSPFPGGPPASRPSPADLLQLGARTPPGGPPRRSLKMWACQVGFIFPSRENQCTLYIFGPLGWLEAGLCLPMYGKSPEGLYTSILHRLLPLSYPVRV